MSTAFLDTATGALFAVDSFGAIVPEPAQDVDDVPDAALADGMGGWATFDSPWTKHVDRQAFGAVLDEVRRMRPSRILSSHLPAAGGHRVDRFLDLLGALPDADTFVPPGCEEFRAMVGAMAAAAAAGAS